MKWTEKELEIIKIAFIDKGLEATKKLLPNRSKNAILLKASKLGIKRRRGYVRRPWSEDEVKVLEKYEELPWHQLLRLLSTRTKNQIKTKALKLGLRRKVGRFHRGFEPLNLKENEKAYLAGFFDGEGSVVLHRYRGRDRWHPEIILANTDLAVIEEIKRILDNAGIKTNLYIQRRGEKTRPVGLLKVQHHDDAYSFLVGLLPYLRIKYEKAKRMVDLIAAKAVGEASHIKAVSVSG